MGEDLSTSNLRRNGSENRFQSYSQKKQSAGLSLIGNSKNIGLGGGNIPSAL